VRDGKIGGVVTRDGEIAAPIVVNCTGPWADRIGAMVGVRYNFSISREHEAVFELPAGFGRIPVVSDVVNRFFFRPHEGGKMLVGEGYPKEQEPCDPDLYDKGADKQVVRRMARLLASRLPSLREVLLADDYGSRLVGGYSGVYDITEDWYPIVGGVPELKGYFAAVGGSGHCFKIAPPIGEALAELIAGRHPTIDISPLSHSRFAEKQLFSSVWGPGNRA